MSYKKTVWLAIFALLFLSSCYRPSNNTLLQQKGKAQTELLQLLQTIDSLSINDEFEPIVVKTYIVKSEEFGSTFPEDPMSPVFLYKAAEFAIVVAKISENQEETILFSQKAITIFDDIQKIYPDFSDIRNCILNKGIIYDDIFHDYENAEIFYREFITRFPTDTLTIGLETYLQHLGKTPE